MIETEIKELINKLRHRKYVLEQQERELEEDLQTIRIEIHTVEEMLKEMKPFGELLYVKEYLNKINDSSVETVMEKE